MKKLNEKDIKQKSKFLSLILRHSPERIQLKLDNNGWADVEELLAKSKRKVNLDLKTLEIVVETNNKKRFSFNEDKTKIRANQGHSLKNIDLELKAVEPPQFLYHGTVDKFMQSIREKGLQKMNRQHVHLSNDRETAVNVGSRRGKPVILSVRTLEMYTNGFEFFLSENGVWLTDNVPSKYIEFKD